MSAFRSTVGSALLLMAVAGTAGAAPDWLRGSQDDRIKALAAIQPGLGTVMMEYSYRYSTIYFAGKAGNWPLAAYQLKEAREIQEVGETTRPEKADALKAFERSFLDPLGKSIEAQDAKRFEATFRAGIRGCNGCHAAQKLPFIKYRLPDRSPAPLVLQP